jgi:hypothetical protein
MAIPWEGAWKEKKKMHAETSYRLTAVSSWMIQPKSVPDLFSHWPTPDSSIRSNFPSFHPLEPQPDQKKKTF